MIACAYFADRFFTRNKMKQGTPSASSVYDVIISDAFHSGGFDNFVRDLLKNILAHKEDAEAHGKAGHHQPQKCVDQVQWLHLQGGRIMARRNGEDRVRKPVLAELSFFSPRF